MTKNYPSLKKLKTVFFILGLILVLVKPTFLFSTEKKSEENNFTFQDPFQLRINSGGGEVSYGNEIFEADRHFNNSGKSIANFGSPIADTNRDEIYQTGRSSNQDLGNFEYSIPTGNGNYELKLHFAEIYWRTAGRRVFSVEVEGTPVIIDLDLVNEVGTRTAVVKTVMTSVIDGTLNIVFTANVNRPTLSALEIMQDSHIEPPTESELTLLTRINAGGENLVFDNMVFEADTYFENSGKSIENSDAQIASTDLDPLYRTARCSTQDLGGFEYAIPVENGDLQILLHFAEIYWFNSGKRVFNVEIEGVPVLVDYDITSDTGTRTATLKTFTTSVTDGILNIVFSANVNRPLLSALEIFKIEQTTEPPNEEPNLLTRINSGGEVLSYENEIFEADSYFNSTGKITSTTRVIANTDHEEIYQTARSATQDLGSFEYAIPVEDAEYDVNLHFAEIYWNDIGKRVFNVEIEGVDVLEEFDIVSEVGTRTALTKSFTVSVSDGMLNIKFIASVNRPLLSAIEIFGDGEIIATPPIADCDWKDLSNSSAPHIEGQSAKIDNKLYLASGYDGNIDLFNSTEIYDIQTDTWSSGEPMPVGVTHGGMVAVEDELWVIGGFVGDTPGPATDKVQIYNTLTNTWSEGPKLPARRGSGAAAFLNNKIHFFGGLLPDRITDSGDHYILDINNPSLGWQIATPLPNPRNHLSAAVVDGIVYAIGGQYGHTGVVDFQKLLHSYDPISESWTRKADLLNDRSHFEMGTAVHNGKIIIAGGRGNNYSIFNTLTQYDTATDTWSELCELPEELLTPVITTSGDRLIMASGGIRGNHNPSYKTRWIQVEPENSSGSPLTNSVSRQNLTTVKIYPNPSRNLFQIDISGESHSFEAVIFDFKGQILKRQVFENSLEDNFLSDLTAGIYLIKIKLDTGEEINHKIIKQ